MLEKSKLLEINRAMLGLGAPVVTDGAGYSQAHYPSMSNLAYKDDLTDAEAYRVASVLMNYTKTQLTQYAADIKESLDVYGKAVKELKVIDYDRKVVKLSWAFNRNISLFIKSSFDKKYFRWTKDSDWVLNLKWDGFDILIAEFDAEGFDTTNVKMIRDNLDTLLPPTDEEVKQVSLKDTISFSRPAGTIDTITISHEYAPSLLDVYHEVPCMFFNKQQHTWECYIEYSAQLYDEYIKAGVPADKIVGLKPYADTVRGWSKSYDLVDVNGYKFKFTPYDFQPVDANTLLAKKWMLNANEMGCGKTFEQVIIGESIPMKKLVICPPTLRLNWKREIQLVNPDANIHIIYSADDFKTVDGWNIIGYTSLDKFLDQLEAENFQVIMVDEAHYIQAVSNAGKPESKRAYGVLRLAATANYVFPITGTPKTNRNVNLFNILRLIRHPLTRGKWAFSNYGKKFCDGQQGRWGWDFSGNSNDDELNDLLKTYMIRHLKKDVLPNLKKHRIVTPVTCDLREYHYEIAEYLKSRTNKNAEDLARLMRARKVLATQKVGESIDFARNIIDQGKKVVIVTCFTDVVKAVEKAFGNNCVKLVGGMSDTAKDAAISEFQTGAPQVMVMNIVAGGVGVTLTAAYNMVINDLDWVPGALTQAEDRICRGGQTELCNIYYLYAEGADMDEVMANTLTEKFDTINAVVDGGTGDSINYLDLLDDALEKSTGIRKVRRVVKVEDEVAADQSEASVSTSAKKTVKQNTMNFSGWTVEQLWNKLDELGGTCKKYDNENIQKMRLVMAIKKLTA